MTGAGAGGHNRIVEVGRSVKGFLQLEILVGICILLSSIAGIMAYFHTNSTAAKRSAGYYQSTVLASSALETAQSVLSNPDSLAFILERVGDSTYTRKSATEYAGIPYALQIQYQKVGAPANLMAVRATIKWGGKSANKLGTVVPYDP